MKFIFRAKLALGVDARRPSKKRIVINRQIEVFSSPTDAQMTAKASQITSDKPVTKKKLSVWVYMKGFSEKSHYQYRLIY